MDYGNIKMTQHALKMSVFTVLKLDIIRKKKDEEKEAQDQGEDETQRARFHRAIIIFEA